MKIKLIIAIDKNGVMGKDNKLPWRLSDDLKHFKHETLNMPILMGSNTFNSLPGILPNREHIVLSKTMDGSDKCSVFTSINEALSYLKESEVETVNVIGGPDIIKQFNYLNLFDELVITFVNAEVIGDASIDVDTDLQLHKWSCYEITKYEQNETNEYSFEIYKYKKTKKRFY
jgi:dihydrofolate reductase